MTEFPLPVTAFPVGQTVRLCFMGLDDDTATRLRAVGVREGCDACVVATGDKCVLGLGAARVALRREVAAGVFATAFATAEPSASPAVR